jgi:hypothetical protein
VSSNLTLSAKTKVVTDSTQQPPAEDEAEFGSLRKRVAELELALSERKALEASFRGFLQMRSVGVMRYDGDPKLPIDWPERSRPSGCWTTSWWPNATTPTRGCTASSAQRKWLAPMSATWPVPEKRRSRA